MPMFMVFELVKSCLHSFLSQKEKLDVAVMLVILCKNLESLKKQKGGGCLLVDGN